MSAAVSSRTALNVSRETQEKLQILEQELRRWQVIKNLVGPATLDQIWDRHIVDSLQLLELAPDAKTWVDLGSGAGFPGLVVAIVGQERGLKVQLVESNSRKCSFLRHVARLTGSAVTVHAARLETIVPTLVGQVDVVSARALASLTQLLEWTEPMLKAGTTGLFPKGRDAESELTEARKRWTFEADVLPSRTDSDARIIRITSIESHS
ncbi:16S rRNA (guanine(527)-N(7))-methyltransferase RsmG [Microvirga guangxiensis]|uniref:Ribosomal RNA small subunit methyltransferase G n=1 Tax=Microvirga guangxiensis TaxID=549386 RepID=A0A1G5FYB8_9HYPH|nr:16S rRNA (guanine(527)-N(7))-methyltransferase RsmG [Microvirga guangxiensis]SCY44097.1 16S rRNA (guanine527-N7)-methyltransferase [Microvirga guangxiensis]